MGAGGGTYQNRPDLLSVRFFTFYDLDLKILRMRREARQCSRADRAAETPAHLLARPRAEVVLKATGLLGEASLAKAVY